MFRKFHTLQNLVFYHSSISGRGKRFFSSPECQNRLWGPTGLFFNEYWWWRFELTSHVHCCWNSEYVVLYFQSPICLHVMHRDNFNFTLFYTQPKIIVLQNNSPWSRLICVCWGVWLGSGSAVGQRNQNLCQGWPQMEGQGEWLDDLSYLCEDYLGFKLFCHIVHTFHMKYVVWMHSDIVMFFIFVCVFYPWQYRVVRNKLLVWKVVPFQQITLGFIQVPELRAKGLHIQISLLKNYVLQKCTLSCNTPL